MNTQIQNQRPLVTNFIYEKSMITKCKPSRGNRLEIMEYDDLELEHTIEISFYIYGQNQDNYYVSFFWKDACIENQFQKKTYKTKSEKETLVNDLYNKLVKILSHDYESTDEEFSSVALAYMIAKFNVIEVLESDLFETFLFFLRVHIENEEPTLVRSISNTQFEELSNAFSDN